MGQSERFAKKSNHPLCTRLVDGQWDFFSAPPSMCDLDSREREGHLHLKELVPPWICLVSKDFFGKFHTFLSGQVLTFLPNFKKTSSNQSVTLFEFTFHLSLPTSPETKSSQSLATKFISQKKYYVPLRFMVTSIIPLLINVVPVKTFSLATLCVLWCMCMVFLFT